MGLSWFRRAKIVEKATSQSRLKNYLKLTDNVNYNDYAIAA